MTSVRDGMMRIYDLTTRKPVGEAPLPKSSDPSSTCAGMTFSNDGKELAAVFDEGGSPRLVCWDLTSGKPDVDQILDPKYDIRRFANDQGRAVEWLPGRDGWLIYGQALIDRQSGRRIWTLPLSNPEFPPTQRRLIDGERTDHVGVGPISGGARSGHVEGEALCRAAARPNGRRGGRSRGCRVASDQAVRRVIPTPRARCSRVLVRWPDAAPSPPKPLINRPIELKNKLFEVDQVICTAGDTAGFGLHEVHRSQLGGWQRAGRRPRTLLGTLRPDRRQASGPQ